MKSVRDLLVWPHVLLMEPSSHCLSLSSDVCVCLAVGLGPVQNGIVGRRLRPFTPQLHKTVEVSVFVLILS